MAKRDRVVIVFERERSNDISTLSETAELVSKAIAESVVMNTSLKVVNVSVSEIDPKNPCACD